MMELVERDPSLHTINNIVTELKARLADAWHTYAVQILKVSYHQETRGRKQNKSPVLNQEEPTNLLLFTSLAEDLVDISNRITDSCVSDVNEAQIVFRYAAKQYEVASTYFASTGNDTARLHAVFKFVSSIAFFASLTTDINRQKSKHEKRRNLLYKIVAEYREKTEYAPELVSYLVDILKLWMNGYDTFTFMIQGTPTYYKLCSSLEEEYQYISDMLQYYTLYYENTI
ncbi:hypothetical protein X777_16430 [Ooceraea biroi]|uniref:KIF-binding protein n=1 Tax=Ooceraea biroi TaxID=2015173 RepID=A0A026X4A2_OOCBI|nr:hypothetical protein X777_16430 [Ooceraea biroi]